MAALNIEQLIKEHHELAVSEFARLLREVAKMRREIKELRRIVRDGEQREFPWFRLAPVRMRMVEAVASVMREHKTMTIPQACAKVWQLIDGGYPSVESLQRYCYEVDIESYV